MNSLGNKEIMAKNIQYYLDKKGIDRNDMCRDLNFKYTTVSNWLQGVKYPRIDKIELMARYFGISKADLVEDHVTPAIQPITFETCPVPLIGDIAAGTPINAEQNIQDYIPVNRAIVDRCNGECFCLKVEGSSMIPEICDGDIIVVDSVIDPSRINARDNIVIMIETTATVKHLSITEKGFLLTANNPDVYEPHFYDCDQVRKLPVIIAGKVVSLQRDF